MDRVLAALQQEPFEPLESDMRWLSLKVVFLMAVVSGRRVAE